MSRYVPIALSALLLAGCATTGARTPGDPYEGFNRGVWGFNRGVDKVLLKPASTVYRTVTPPPARRGLSRVFANLSEPFSAINALLQGKPKRMFNSLGRFVINTTLGVGGLADHATGMGLKPTPEDFGQTLAVWGIKSSAYLVIPILGPSTVRDGVGAGAAQFLDPYRVCLRTCNLPNGLPLAATALEIVSTRSQLTDGGADAFLDASADSYATARSAFLQRRAAQLADQDDDGARTPQGDDAALDDALKDIDAQGGTPDRPANPGLPPPPPPPPGPYGPPLRTSDPASDAAPKDVEAQQATGQKAAGQEAPVASPSGTTPPMEAPKLPFFLPDR